MPDLATYQTHVDAIYATLRAAEKVTGPIAAMQAHHAALKAGLDTLAADNPGLVQPDDGDPKT
jgi:hypothetical protein